VVSRRRGFTVVELIAVVSIIALIAVLAIPGLLSSRRSANETSAVAALRLIATAQAAFREADKDNDAQADYATLPELYQVGLLDEVLGSGEKNGYRFEVAPSAGQPTVLWFAMANPIVPGSTGERAFVVNHAGVVFYTGGAVTLNTTDCLIPTGCQPVGGQ
jgi:prepilin-type N-terminal cleavage/methylation domain-containing protein